MKTIFLNKTLLLLVAFGAALCLLPINVSAQWTDGGTNFRTNNNVVIGNPHVNHYDSYSLYVRKDKPNWQGRFANRGGAGADVYLADGRGYGMHIRGYTTGNQYTLELYNKNERTNIFYNNGKVGLGLAGDVGVGTASPGAKLDVSGNIRIGVNSDAYIENTTGFIGIRPADATHGFIMRDYTGATYQWSGMRHVDNGSADRLEFAVMGAANYGKSLILTQDNKVGIGAIPTDYELEVNGTIRAKEIIVEEGWGDYVFYDDYQLPTLEEEEKHIEENGHLLGFESEEDMAGEIQLGDVIKKQQVKIEEMMLHLIELKKENKVLKEEVKQLKK